MFTIKAHDWPTTRVPTGAFDRWDDAMKEAVVRMACLFCDFRVHLTKEAPDGSSIEWTITANTGKDDAARIVVLDTRL